MRGLDVVPADSMAAALSLAAEADFDVLVSDIELQDGNGLELMCRLRDSLAAGFALHLVKPVDFRRLEQAIRDVAAATPAESLVNR